MLIVTPQAAPRLPIGTVLQYSGIQIANVAARTLPLGQEIGDTISDIPFGTWYVCNGNTGTPNILNKFVRCEDSSGVFGGSDLHTLTTAEIPSHAHGGETGGVSNQTGTNAGRDYHTSGYATGFDYSAIWAVVSNRFLAHAHSIPSQGSGGAHNNIPAYYSLIFIIRMG